MQYIPVTGAILLHFRPNQFYPYPSGLRQCVTFLYQLRLPLGHWCNFVPIFFNVTSLAVGQYNCASANEANLKNMGKIIRRMSNDVATFITIQLMTDFTPTLHEYNDCLTLCSDAHQLCITGLCMGKSTATGGFPTQRPSNVKNVSLSWCHHVIPWLNSMQHPVGNAVVIWIGSVKYGQWSLATNAIPCLFMMKLFYRVIYFYHSTRNDQKYTELYAQNLDASTLSIVRFRIFVLRS